MVPTLATAPSTSPSVNDVTQRTSSLPVQSWAAVGVKMTLRGIYPLNEDSAWRWSVVTSNTIAAEAISIIEAENLEVPIDEVVENLEVSITLTSQYPPFSPRRELVSSRGMNTRNTVHKRTDLRMLSQMVQELTFDVLILIQSVDITHDVDQYVLGAFNGEDERNDYLSDLRLTGDPAFANAESVHVASASFIPLQRAPITKDTIPEENSKLLRIILFAALGAAGAALAGFSACFVFWRKAKGASRAVSSELKELRESDISSEIDVHTKGGVSISSLGDPIPLNMRQTSFPRSASDSNTITLDYDFREYHGGTSSSLVGSSQGDSNHPHSLVTKDDNTLEAEYHTRDHFFEVECPTGMLGLVLQTSDAGIPVVNLIKRTSPLAGQVQIGDRLMSVDGVDVTVMWASDASHLIASKKDNPVRRLMFTRPLGNGFEAPTDEEHSYQ